MATFNKANIAGQVHTVTHFPLHPSGVFRTLYYVFVFSTQKCE